MATVQIGETVIEYGVRRSTRATRSRLVVRPEGVEVVAPAEVSAAAVAAFVERKRRWLFDAVRAVAARQAGVRVQRWGSGAKVQFRGRWLMLDVRAGAVEAAEVVCRSKFVVTVPAGAVGEAREAATRDAVRGWLDARAEEDARQWARRHAARLGVAPVEVRMGSSRREWGSCGRDGVVRINRDLIEAPAAAMEYVVAHEVTHRVHRHHEAAFWQTLGETLPGWREGKALLERWERSPRGV